MDASKHDALVPVNSAASIATRLKLNYLNHAKLLELSPPELTFSNLLSLVAQAFPETVRNGKTPTIELSYSDEDGDTVIIDSEESFALAVLSFQKTQPDAIKLQIHVIKAAQSSSSNSPNGSFIRAPSTAAPSPAVSNNYSRQPGIPCWHFQADSCRHGSSCRFLHNPTDFSRFTSVTSLSDDSDIEQWLITLKRAPEHDNISYLTSPEGYDSFLRVLNHPHLPQMALHHLVSLLTRPKLRTSVLKQATDKIYNALVGTQFLNALHLHIRASVKPILFCIEPYVLLCEELMSRTSSGWKEVPLDELKTLMDKVKTGLIKELSDTVARLLDHRAEKKRLEAVDEKLDAHGLDSNYGDIPIIPPKEQPLT